MAKVNDAIQKVKENKARYRIVLISNMEAHLKKVRAFLDFCVTDSDIGTLTDSDRLTGKARTRTGAGEHMCIRERKKG